MIKLSSLSISLWCSGMVVVRLSRAVSDLILEEVRRGYPIEVCGVLFGFMYGGVAYVVEAVTLRNILGSRYMFQIDPEEFLNVLREYEGRGLQHIGFFHSHPRYAKPSSIDLKYMALWPGSIWVIVSYRESRIEAYRLVDGCLEEARIIIE